MRGSDREVVLVLVDDGAGTVLEDWTEPQVAWTMARGYPGAFGRAVNSPWIWLGLTAPSSCPCRPPPRPLSRRGGPRRDRILGVSVAFFNDAQIDAPAPLAYPPLLYLLGRRGLPAARASPAPRHGR